ncbi:MAG: alpha/beta fold hydrolase [Planctomycetaceae bacterium]
MTLHFRHYPATGIRRGIVVALHGIQSHSAWYEFSSRRMADAGFDVYFADRRGSGLNGRLRGHADHGMRLLNDVRQLVRLAKNWKAESQAAKPGCHRPGDVPVTLLGVSWGGKIAAAFAATYPELIDRLALLYPGLEPKLCPTWWQRLRLHLARRHDVRHKSVEIPLSDPALFTDDAGCRKFIADDPLALHHVTSGLLNAGNDLDEIIRQNADRITHPTLVMLAGHDEIIDNAATRRRVATFSIRHLTQICYSEARHTLEFDASRELFARDLVHWLSTERLEPTATTVLRMAPS